PAFPYRNRYALEVPLVIESGFFDKLRVLPVRLRFRCPRVEFPDEWCLREFVEIRKKNGARVRRYQRQGRLARSTVLYAPFPIPEKSGRAHKDDYCRQPDPSPLLHTLPTI